MPRLQIAHLANIGAQAQEPRQHAAPKGGVPCGLVVDDVHEARCTGIGQGFIRASCFHGRIHELRAGSASGGEITCGSATHVSADACPT